MKKMTFMEFYTEILIPWAQEVDNLFVWFAIIFCKVNAS